MLTITILHIQFLILIISWIVLTPFDKTINFIEKRIGNYYKVLTITIVSQIILLVITILTFLK